jgi:hypothetical protein
MGMNKSNAQFVSESLCVLQATQLAQVQAVHACEDHAEIAPDMPGRG